MGFLFSRHCTLSRSIRFKLGQMFVVISFTVLLTKSVIAITNFSHEHLARRLRIFPLHRFAVNRISGSVFLAEKINT